MQDAKRSHNLYASMNAANFTIEVRRRLSHAEYSVIVQQETENETDRGGLQRFTHFEIRKALERGRASTTPERVCNGFTGWIAQYHWCSRDGKPFSLGVQLPDVDRVVVVIT